MSHINGNKMSPPAQKKRKKKRERGRTYIVRCDPSVAESTGGNSRRKIHAIGTKITFHFCC